MSELLPCPFCGNPNPEIRHNNIGDSFVICHTDVEGEMCCDASSRECGCETDAGAVQRWNLRAPPASPTGRQLGPGKRDELPPIVSEGVAELVEAATAMLAWAEYETEYDGRTYRICHSCDGQDGRHGPNCKVEAYRSALSKATGEGG